MEKVRERGREKNLKKETDRNTEKDGLKVYNLRKKETFKKNICMGRKRVCCVILHTVKGLRDEQVTETHAHTTVHAAHIAAHSTHTFTQIVVCTRSPRPRTCSVSKK